MREYYEMMKSMLDDYEAFVEWEKQGAIKRGIRVNRLKIGINEFKEQFRLIYGIDLERTPFSSNGYEVDCGYGDGIMHRAGLFYMQEPSAMSAITALTPYIGSRILDMCAAPGGKSTQAASVLGDRGVIVCNEIVFNRAKILRSNIERCGVRNAVITNNTPQSIANALPGYFDTVIVDAPCSGEGMFLKEPQAKDSWSIEYVRECADRQLTILEAADKALALNGVIVYSTCTYNTIENEEVVKRFTAVHDYELLPITGLENCSSPAYGLANARRVFPHRHGGGLGHFVCVMRKRSACSGEEITLRNPFVKYDDKNFNAVWKEIACTSQWAQTYKFNDGIYLIPKALPFAKGLNIVTAGVRAADDVRGRIVPHHALAMALRKGEANVECELNACGEAMARYLRGEIITGVKGKGYRAVTFNGYPIGLVKFSDGTAKNHYPKGLRRIGTAKNIDASHYE